MGGSHWLHCSFFALARLRQSAPGSRGSRPRSAVCLNKPMGMTAVCRPAVAYKTFGVLHRPRFNTAA
jgi:hypothetical protein